MFKCLNANDRIAMDAGVVSSACLALTRLLEHSDGRSSYWAAKPKSKKDKVLVVLKFRLYIEKELKRSMKRISRVATLPLY